jgi:hypothetical protein
MLRARPSSRGVESMGSFSRLSGFPDFGAGRTTENLTWARDDDGRICVFAGVWHGILKVVDDWGWW